MTATPIALTITDAPDARRPDPFAFDLDALRLLLPEDILRAGLGAANAHRVTWAERVSATQIIGHVEDDEGRDTLEVNIDAEDTILIATCPCPGSAKVPLCQHAVALLVALDRATAGAAPETIQAASEAIAARQKRAAHGVVVQWQRERPGSVWSARSLDAVGLGGAHEVEVLALEPPVHQCSCPDFLTNELGTCKHIEAVRRKLQAPRTRGRPAAPSRPVAWLDASGGRPQLRLLLPHDPALQGRLLPLLEAPGGLPADLVAALDACDAALAPAPGPRRTADLAKREARLRARPALLARRLATEAAVRASGGALPGARAHLYPYQVEGVAFLAGRGRALLADDMGLGKTLQTLAAAQWLAAHHGVRHVLVVCPTSLKRQWADEIAQFVDASAVIVEGNAAARLACYRRRATFTIANYETVMRDLSVVRDQFPPDLLVLDEAQRIKNWRTRTAATIKSLPSDFTFVLTGTPLENRLEDLYSLLQAVDPHLLGPLWRFEQDHMLKDERGRLVGYRNLSALRRRTAEVMLRRSREVVRDQLPSRMVTRRLLPLSERQTELHDAALRQARLIQQTAEQQHRPLTPGEEKRIMALLQTARMACDAAGLVDRTTEGSPKLEEFELLLQELCVEGGEKVVVFSQWERMTAMAESVARRLGLGSERLHGGVPAKLRGDMVKRFREDPACQVFLSTDAGGTGLNLQCASWLINLDLPWNPAVLDQRLGRIHRLGQRRTAHMVLLIAAGSYEGRVAEILATKRALFGASVAGTLDVDSVGINKRTVELAMAALADLGEEAGRGDDAAAAKDDAGALIDAAATAVEAETEAQAAALAAEALAEAPAEPDADRLAEAAGGPDAAAEPGVAGAAAAESAGDPGAEAAATADPLEAAPQAEDGLGFALTALERLLGARLVRVLVTASGLCAVVSSAEAGDALAAEAIDPALPIAVLDEATFAALRRLGAATPLHNARVVRERAAPPTDASAALREAAQRKLRGAHALAAAGAAPEALALAADAMLAALGARAGRSEAVARGDAGAWLYGEAVVRGVCTAAEAAALLRADGLARAVGLPETLVEEVLAEAAATVRGASESGGGAGG